MSISTAMTVGGKIYQRLLDVVPDLMTLNAGAHGKSEVPGFMALNLDVLHRDGGLIEIALNHLYKHPSGEMIPDPDMQIAVFPEREYAEALTYQDMFGFRDVGSEAGRANLRAQRELNAFLLGWLANLIEQGHAVSMRADTDADIGQPGSASNLQVVSCEAPPDVESWRV